MSEDYGGPPLCPDCGAKLDLIGEHADTWECDECGYWRDATAAEVDAEFARARARDGGVQ